MKIGTNILLGIVFLLLLITVSETVFAADCGGVPDCNYEFPSECNAACGCGWTGSKCIVKKGCNECLTEGQCLSSGCSWTFVPPSPPQNNESNQNETNSNNQTSNNQTTNNQTTTTTTSTTSSNIITLSSNARVIDLIVDEPTSLVLIPNGELLLQVRCFENGALSGNVDVYSTSKLFGALQLVNNFKNLGQGYYGKVAYIYQMQKGIYDITFKGINSDMSKETTVRLNIDPSIDFELSLDSRYEKGKSIFFEGYLENVLGDRVRDTPVTISFESGSFNYQINASSDYLGRISLRYPISFAEPSGTWKITISAEDEYGNFGSRDYFINVTSPPNTEYYSIVFQSPLDNTVVKRGDVIPISVKVLDGDLLVQDADVTFKDPYGNSLVLDEKSPGIYSTEYLLEEDGPIGDWNLFLQALNDKGGIIRAGGNEIELNVKEATLSISELSPRSYGFFTGQQIEFRTEVVYSNNNPLINGLVYAYFGSEKIRLKPDGEGIYSAKYLILPEDKDKVSISFYAEDTFGNSYLTSPRTIEVEGLSGAELQLRLFYYNFILKYLYVIIFSLLGLVLLTQPLWYHVRLGVLRRTLQNSYAQNVESQKEIQRKYFKFHLISRDAYDNLMLKYKEKESDLRDKLNVVERKLNLNNKKSALKKTKPHTKKVKKTKVEMKKTSQSKSSKKSLSKSHGKIVKAKPSKSIVSKKIRPKKSSKPNTKKQSKHKLGSGKHKDKKR